MPDKMEYISREAAVRAMARGERFIAGDGTLTGKLISARGAAQRIRKVKAADVEPVRHGRWEQELISKDEENGTETWTVQCSECKIAPLEPFTNYCSNCGADMREATGNE